MNYKYILKEIEKANKNTIKAYEKLEYYKNNKNEKNLNYSEYHITEANEILTNLEISIELEMEKENDKL